MQNDEVTATNVIKLTLRERLIIKQHREKNAKEPAETGCVNAILYARGWDPAEVDLRMGHARGTFVQMRSRGFPGDGLRSRYERLFECRIWSDRRTYDLRENCFRRYGFDPALLDLSELRAWIEKLNLKHRVRPGSNHADLVNVILQRMAINTPI